ncbi:MAG: electron transfer flavoprotein subunit beta/FixA family protein [SAR324 cluster bacterium]|nr:electron transfer flavoprotein subunit beta/FixA family protein [SAR324 cluster bacterium]
MKILVCIKQVPDMESKFKVSGDGVTIEETDLAFRINEYDEYAIEQAVQTKEKNEGSELVVACLGADRASEAIKKALAMGCDRAIHIVDNESQTKDSFQVASLLKSAVSEENFDLIFTGMQSQDRGSAQVGILLAEMLGIDSVSTIVSFELSGDEVAVKRELEGGIKGLVKVKLPALLTCQLGLNKPRYPTLPNIMKAKKKPVDKMEVASLAAVENVLTVKNLHPPAKKGQALYLEGDVNDIADKLIAELKAKTAVLS